MLIAVKYKGHSRRFSTDVTPDDFLMLMQSGQLDGKDVSVVELVEHESEGLTICYDFTRARAGVCPFIITEEN